MRFIRKDLFPIFSSTFYLVDDAEGRTGATSHKASAPPTTGKVLSASERPASAKGIVTAPVIGYNAPAANGIAMRL